MVVFWKVINVLLLNYYCYNFNAQNFTAFNLAHKLYKLPLKKLSTLWMENFVTEVRSKKKLFSTTRFFEINDLFITMADFFTFLMSTNSHIIWISFCTSCKEMWKIVLQICGSNKKCRTFFSTLKRRDRPIFAEIVVTKGLS